jgi:hypothetical protein
MHQVLEKNDTEIFFLEHAGELRIFVLREKKSGDVKKIKSSANANACVLTPNNNNLRCT